MVRKKTAVLQKESLQIQETSKAVEYLTFVCPRGREELLPTDANPVCGGACCNYSRKMKPKVTCLKCAGSGRVVFNKAPKCKTCWGEGKLNPEFTEAENQ